MSIKVLVSCVLLLSSLSFAQSKEKQCIPRQYIISVNVGDQTPREGLLQSWKLLEGNSDIESRFLSGSSEQIIYVIRPRNMSEGAKHTEDEILEKLSNIPGVAIECDQLVGPNNEGSLFQ